jgi:hypothetical protein
MSARVTLGFPRKLGTSPFVAVTACLTALSAPAFAQSTADAPVPPIAGDAPTVAPAPADSPAAQPSKPAPPNQAPAISEPTPTPTLAPASAAEGGASKPEPPSGSAAFAPLPAPTREIAKPQPLPPSAPPDEAPPRPYKPVSHASYDDQSAKDDDSGGLLGPFRIGVLVGTGLPEVANLGAQIKLTRFLGVGVNVGLIPTVKISYYGDATLKYQEYDVYGRIYPFGGIFFLGAGVGYANIKGSLASHFDTSAVQAMYPGVPGIPASVDVFSDASVRTLVLTPQIGLMKIFDVGFAIGVDFGAQVPIAPSKVEFNTVAPGVPGPIANEVRTRYINPNDERVRSTLEKIGRTPLPTFNFKIGWFL